MLRLRKTMTTTSSSVMCRHTETERRTDVLARIRVSKRFRPRPDSLSRLARRYGLQLIVMFGSQVTGRTHPESDVDIAVLPERGRRFNWLRFYSDLVPVMANDRLDIVNLRRCPPLLAWNVAREGLLLYAADAADWDRFRIRAMKEFEDVKRFDEYRLRSIDRSLREWGLLK